MRAGESVRKQDETATTIFLWIRSAFHLFTLRRRGHPVINLSGGRRLVIPTKARHAEFYASVTVVFLGTPPSTPLLVSGVAVSARALLPLLPSHIHALTLSHTLTHALTHAHALTHSLSHIHAHSRTLTHSLTLTHPYSRTHALTHSHPHSHPHTWSLVWLLAVTISDHTRGLSL